MSKPVTRPPGAACCPSSCCQHALRQHQCHALPGSSPRSNPHQLQRRLQVLCILSASHQPPAPAAAPPPGALHPPRCPRPSAQSAAAGPRSSVPPWLQTRGWQWPGSLQEQPASSRASRRHVWLCDGAPSSSVRVGRQAAQGDLCPHLRAAPGACAPAWAPMRWPARPRPHCRSARHAD